METVDYLPWKGQLKSSGWCTYNGELWWKATWSCGWSDWRSWLVCFWFIKISIECLHWWFVCSSYVTSWLWQETWRCCSHLDLVFLAREGGIVRTVQKIAWCWKISFTLIASWHLEEEKNVFYCRRAWLANWIASPRLYNAFTGMFLPYPGVFNFLAAYKRQGNDGQLLACYFFRQ